jgi:hypothetical protein
MTIAAAIFLIAVGAILRYATNINVEGVSLDTVGLILMIAGAAGLVLSFLQEAVLSGRTRRREAEAQARVEAEQRVAAEQRPTQEGREPPAPGY